MSRSTSTPYNLADFDTVMIESEPLPCAELLFGQSFNIGPFQPIHQLLFDSIMNIA
jgi:hypothetical protein